MPTNTVYIRIYAVAQCKILGISRGSYYYEAKSPKDETPFETAVQTAFEENRSLYGSRKLKKVLSEAGITLSRRKICRIMKRRGLESAYTHKKYKNHSTKYNEANVPNLLDRQFNGHAALAAVVSDLTYRNRRIRYTLRMSLICGIINWESRT
ncbi:MAG: IS3 family transposase [Oscillospiraceae bacterium]|nr:IS3 family transposase [Oscillospiraceae bacterium]